MSTSWKKICGKLKMQGIIGGSKNRGGSDESASTNSQANSDLDTALTTNSSTPQLSSKSRSQLNNEWQMNYMIINRQDGLYRFRKPKVKREKKEEKKAGWNAGPKEVKPKVSSRINTNMVKLKLLDATRKAILEKQRKQQISSAVQTDPIKTKLCKDQFIEVQDDLIFFEDQSTETELELLAIKAKDGMIIVTSSCAVGTELLMTESAATQTVMPRSNVSFKSVLDGNRSIQFVRDEKDDDESNKQSQEEIELANIEDRMQLQSKIPSQKSSPSKISSPLRVTETVQQESLVISDKNSDSEYEDSIQDAQPDVVQASVKRAKHEDSTFNSWQDVDRFSAKSEMSNSFVAEGPTPWSNFQDLVLGQRFLNARLSSNQKFCRQASFRQAAWTDSQVKVVRDLISEANALMDMFDQVAMLLGPDIELHNVSDAEDFIMPPNKYSEEMSKSCEKLEKSLKRLDEIQMTKNKYENDRF